MILDVDHGAGEFRKRAETPAEADRLRREARVLDVARHPGVVQLLAMDGDTLRLRLLDGRPLRLSDSAVDGAAVAPIVATTVADLHDLGVVHGDITAAHILIDGSGQPVLCEFGQGAVGAEVAAGDLHDDVVALAATLLAAIPADDVQAPILATAARGATRGLSARTLAHRLTAASAAGPLSPSHRGHPHRWAATVVLTAAAAAVTVAVAVTAVAFRDGGNRQSAGLAPVTLACPAVDRGCRPLPRPGGVLETAAGRYRIGRPDDVVVVGRWRCTAALPALLEPGSGEVWVFDHWAGVGQPAPARLVARIPGATSVQVEPEPSGCDRLKVVRPGTDPVDVRPDEPA